jgi:flagellar hook-length control protein FliK
LPQGEPAHPASVQLLQQITPGIKSMVRDGLESMRLQLNPAELGKIDLHLVSRSGEIHIAMVAESASTGALLEHNMADLRQSLQQAGVSLAEVTVGQGSDQGEQAWKWESARPSGKQGFFPTASSDVEEQTGINRSSIRGNGSTLVDYLI